MAVKQTAPVKNKKELARQLGISRQSLYYCPKLPEKDFKLKTEIEKELIDLVQKTGQKLNTLPGCGPTLSAVVLSEIKDIHRFESPARLAKYAGLAPRKLESGKQKRRVKTKSGNRRLNKAIYQIALTQISNQGIAKAKAYFQKKVSEGKSKKHALTCLKRQISDIIWSMLKEQRAYYP